MSRWTQSPFRKPSPFAHIPSPPDTNSDLTLVAPTRAVNSQPPPPHPSASLDDSSEQFMPPMDYLLPTPRPKKSSTLSYNSSGIKEAREKTVQRSLRSFIVVIPPTTLSHEHGHLGPTLSSGPLHRLSQGILMPLFPTMYGQITAIAREFNFPSTTGLCLYLQWSDAGVTITPRISDESWPFLWNHAFDPSHTSPPGIPPICGRIEFDIDFQQARWYPSWVSSRDAAPTRSIPVSPPTRPLSRVHHHHQHTDSRTTYEEELDDASFQGSLTVTRHVPKKLSLVDRYETPSIRSPPKDSGLAAPDHVPNNNILSPIPQASEPPSAKVDLQTRVNSWRASASLQPTPLAVSNGQTSLEPANLPNNLSLDPSLDEDIQSDLNLDDFTWSISSLGPRDYFDGASIYSTERVPSVHLANRLEGSVCLTSPTCTSFGPSDFDEEYVAYPSSIRVPTPDVAMRMWEDCPLTPSTATSWGAPLSYPPTPDSVERPLSIDIAYRFLHSRPVTPSTATSWGPPLSYPPTPDSVERPLSIDIAYRFLHSRPVTPTTATSWGPPSWPSSPAMSDFRPPSIHMADRGETSLPVTPLFGTWDTSVRLPRNYPLFDLYPTVYPNFDLYPTVAEGVMPVAEVLVQPPPITQRPELVARPWPHVWPYTEKRHRHSASTASAYPLFDLYPAVYPHFNLYPSPVRIEEPLHSKAKSVSTHVHPTFNALVAQPWPHVWPYTERRHRHSASTAPAYPLFDLYPAVYPHFNLYPSLVQIEEPFHSEAKSASVDVYPASNLDPTVPSIQPLPVTQQLESVTRPWPHVWPYTERRHRHSASTASAYPLFDLYPAVYPHFNLYPSPVRIEEPLRLKAKSVSTYVYPTFNLYPAVYPHFDLYPSLTVVETVSMSPIDSRGDIPVKHPAVYPTFDLYPSVYPHNLYQIYRTTIMVQADADILSSSLATALKTHVTVQLHAIYPTFDLYPAVYPYNLDYIYKRPAVVVETPGINIAVTSKYPFIQLYRPVYPHVQPYPIIAGQAEEPGFTGVICTINVADQKIARQSEVSMVVPARYPFFNLYQPVYPYVIPYPSLPGQIEKQHSIPTSRFSNRRTHAELHASVFFKEFIFSDRSKITPSKTHAQLHQEVISSIPAALRISSIPSTTSPRRALPEAPSPQLPQELTSPQRNSPRRVSRLPIPPPPPISPVRRLPAPPSPPADNGHSIAFPHQRTSRLSLGSGGLAPPAGLRGLPATPKLRTQSSFDSSINTKNYSPQRVASLDSLKRSYSLARALPVHDRSQSIATPISPVPEQMDDQIHRSRSAHPPPPLTTVRIPPKRRDSLVLQRVKALNSMGDEIPTNTPSQEFVEPPKAPGKGVPSPASKLDRSRYSVFS